MKKFMTLALICCSFVMHSVADAQTSLFLKMSNMNTEKGSVKAAREFWKMNGDGKDEKWYKLPGGYLAEYTEGSVQHKLVFDRGGNWLYTMREYTEKDLPKEVRALVKSTYYDFNIGWVKEVSQPQSLVYVVHIDDASEWKDLLVCDGEIEIQREVTK